MRKYVSIVLLLLSCRFVPAGTAQSQQSSNEAGRKLIRKVEPTYPEMARRVNMAGTVKVFAVVAADGNVKSVEPLGGSPVLVQAAEAAVSHWKFAPANAESKELIELHFHPN